MIQPKYVKIVAKIYRSWSQEPTPRHPEGVIKVTVVEEVGSIDL